MIEGRRCNGYLLAIAETSISRSTKIQYKVTAGISQKKLTEFRLDRRAVHGVYVLNPNAVSVQCIRAVFTGKPCGPGPNRRDPAGPTVRTAMIT